MSASAPLIPEELLTFTEGKSDRYFTTYLDDLVWW